MNQPTDVELRRYLLRQLPAGEGEALEAAYFGDAGVLSRLEDVEDDLARAYLAGELGPSDRVAFEQMLSESPARRARLAFHEGVKARVRDDLARAAAPVASGRWTSSSRWLMAAAAAAVVAVGAWWSLRPAMPPDTTVTAGPPSTTPAPAAVAPVPPAPRGPVVVIALATIGTRAGGGTPTAEVPADASAVVLRVSEPMPRLEAIHAEVRNVDTGDAWRGVARAPGPGAPPETTAEVEVPPGQLPAGDYVLTLGAGAAPDAEALLRAYFRVVRP